MMSILAGMISMNKIKAFINRVYDALYRRFHHFIYFLKRKNIMNSYDSNIFYLNIGAGKFCRSNWRVLEYAGEETSYGYDTSLIDFNLNLFNDPKFSINDNSVNLIYSSHTFEHLNDKNVQHILNESFRILKKGAGIRVTMPDIDLAYNAYLKSDVNFFNTLNNQLPGCDSLISKFFDYFSQIDVSKYNTEILHNDFTSLSKENFLNKYTLDINDSIIRTNFGAHMNWFNEDKLRKMFAKAGFSNTKKMKYKESQFSEMTNKEFDNTHPMMSIYYEAIKN